MDSVQRVRYAPNTISIFVDGRISLLGEVSTLRFNRSYNKIEKNLTGLLRKLL